MSPGNPFHHEKRKNKATNNKDTMARQLSVQQKPRQQSKENTFPP